MQPHPRGLFNWGGSQKRAQRISGKQAHASLLKKVPDGHWSGPVTLLTGIGGSSTLGSSGKEKSSEPLQSSPRPWSYISSMKSWSTHWPPEIGSYCNGGTQTWRVLLKAKQAQAFRLKKVPSLQSSCDLALSISGNSGSTGLPFGGSSGWIMTSGVRSVNPSSLPPVWSKGGSAPQNSPRPWLKISSMRS